MSTPMMQQYREIKAEYPGFLLFYRMGDFYELFEHDAIAASSMLGITLTKRRNKKDDDGVPMCGVPFHAAEGYIARLIEEGEKVALCEQTETPEEAKKRGGHKALVKREVIRLYTSGTLTEESMLAPEQNNYLVALMGTPATLGLGWLDLSTGEFKVTTSSARTLVGDLARLAPREILITQKCYDQHADVLVNYQQQLSLVSNHYFSASNSAETLKKALDVATLDAFNLAPHHQSACGALIRYVADTQKGALPTLQHPQVVQMNGFLYMDASTRQNLELTTTLRGVRNGSLIHAIDQTVTPAGSRMLSRWVTAPLMNVGMIHQRQAAINAFRVTPDHNDILRGHLKQTTDMSRALSRITLGRGSPRDLSAVRTTLRLMPEIANVCRQAVPGLLSDDLKSLGLFTELTKILDKALIEETPPLLARDGGFIKRGYCQEFDAQKEMATGGMALLKELEQREIARTGISTLRVKYNKVWGYFMEIPKSQASKVPEDFIHRQTTTQAQRFSSTTLMELERKYSAAEASSLAQELTLFDELTKTVAGGAPELLRAAEALATLDVISAGAVLAERYHYSCPVVDDSAHFIIDAGRHPVVEQTVENYIPNSSALSNQALWLITGPNMSGKSTFLRQNALITILAHMGYHVPAKAAHIGLVDRIFTRIGAADDLARGQSTFMMEMVETAAILNGATDKSLVILDEIGRGTATYDGLSIAWACVEHLVTKNRSRGLFATHYHEMTVLESQYDNLSCHHVQVKEWEGDIVFLHSVGKGAAPRSYGIHVGRLAGLPKAVTKRAEVLLEQLESGGGATNQTQLPLFSGAPEVIIEKQTSRVEETLAAVELDTLSPRDAQNLLYELKGLLA